MIKIRKGKLLSEEKYCEGAVFPDKSSYQIEEEVAYARFQLKNGFMSKKRFDKVMAKLNYQLENSRR